MNIGLKLDALWTAYQVGQASADHTDKQVFKEIVGNALRADLSKREWISVEERLPEDGGKVLCVGDRGDPVVAVYSASDTSYQAEHFTGAFLGWLQYDCSYAVILIPTHWMPLPEPPK